MKIAVNGTEVAGPTLAYWLRRYGRRSQLSDAISRGEETGYGPEIRRILCADELVLACGTGPFHQCRIGPVPGKVDAWGDVPARSRTAII